MTFQTLPGGFIEAIPPNFSSLSGNVTAASTSLFNHMTFDGAGDKLAWIGRLPKTGTLTKLMFRVGGVTTGATMRMRLETVDPATGLPTGTLLVASAEGTTVLADTDDNSWRTVSLNAGAGVSVTQGQICAVVLEVSSGTPNFTVQGTPNTFMVLQGFPYRANNLAGTWAKDPGNTAMPFMVVYTGDVYEFTHGMTCGGGLNFSAIGNNNERALRFQLPVPMQISGVVAALCNVSAGANYRIILADASGTLIDEIDAAADVDGDIYASTTLDAMAYHYFDSTIDLAANTTYYVSVHQKTAANLTIPEITVEAAAHMAAAPGGSNFYSATRVGGTGTFTDTTTARPLIHLIPVGIHDGAGAGGSGAPKIKINVPAGPWNIDDTLTFNAITLRGTGALFDATGAPAYRIYEDETGTPILTGSMTKLDDAGTTGFYSEQITLSAANGLEVGKSYSVYVSATVDSVSVGETGSFKMVSSSGSGLQADDDVFSYEEIPQSTAKKVVFRAKLSSTGAPATGKTIAITISKDGGAFANPSAGATNATEISDGLYHFTLSTTDTNTVGPLVYKGTEASIATVMDAFTVSQVLTVAEIADAVWDEATTGHTTVGTFGEQCKTDIDSILTNTGTTASDVATIDTNVTAIKAKTDNLPLDPADASVIAGEFTTVNTKLDVIGNAVDTEVAAIKAKTDQLTFSNANQVDATVTAMTTDVVSAAALATSAVQEIADGILDRNLATGTDSGSASVRTVRQALRALRNKVSVSGGTATIYKEDDTTASWTAAVATTAGDPVTSVDPADV